MATVKTRYGSGRPTDYQRAVAGFLNDIAAEMVEFLVVNKRVATGAAVNSFEVDVTETRKDQMKAELSAVNYINFALNGRGAGAMPPVDAIARWIEVKGIDLNPWAVAKTIAALGTNDPHFGESEVETAIELAWQKWGDKLSQAYAEQAAELIAQSFTSRDYFKNKQA